MTTKEIITAAFFVDGRYLGTIHAWTHEQLNETAARLAANHAPKKCYIELPMISEKVVTL